MDTETTGLGKADRVVEIALVTIDLNGDIVERWDTLIQPQRDIGPVHIHGISASMVASAPTFDQVAGDIAARLEGACLAAHNLPFDQRMIAGEFDRLGAVLHVPSGLDTLAATKMRLGDACQANRINLTGAHRALADAEATAALLRRVAGSLPPGSSTRLSGSVTGSGKVLRREDTRPVRLPDPPFIVSLASRTSHAGTETKTLSYLDVLGRALADLHLDHDEFAEVTDLAASLGLDEASVASAHRSFVDDLVDVALADKILTDEEYSALLRTAAALDVDPASFEPRLRAFREGVVDITLQPGTSIVVTGEHPTHQRSAVLAHAEHLGLVPQANVTKTTGVVAAADPASASGKASKARTYGVPIVSINNFMTARPGDTLTGVGISVESLKVITCPACRATQTVPATKRTKNVQLCATCAAGN